MKKLEDIPKKQNFEVPEGYFEKLPGIIQSRVTKHRKERIWGLDHRVALRFAVAVVILLAAGNFWYSRSQMDKSVENILASVQTEDLITYLSESDFTTDELLEDAQLNNEDAMDIEESVYELQFTDSEFEKIFNEIEQ
jgi:hypothetical protein